MMILGVRIDPIRKTALKQTIERLLDDGAPHMVATPNPEMLVFAYHNPEFRVLLNQSDLNVPDGIGVVLMSRLVGQTAPERVTGVDVLYELAASAAERRSTLYLLGDETDVSDKAAQYLREKFPGLQVRGDSGGTITRRGVGEWDQDPAILSRIRDAEPTILAVALGHGKQEQWIADHLSGLPSVRIAIGVGGALRYCAGRVRRAPHLLQRAGLEWLWRLVQEPRRFRRILTATVIFPLLVLQHRKGGVV